MIEAAKKALVNASVSADLADEFTTADHPRHPDGSLQRQVHPGPCLERRRDAPAMKPVRSSATHWPHSAASGTLATANCSSDSTRSPRRYGLRPAATTLRAAQSSQHPMPRNRARPALSGQGQTPTWYCMNYLSMSSRHDLHTLYIPRAPDELIPVVVQVGQGRLGTRCRRRR
jgi:hypothetical protein